MLINIINNIIVIIVVLIICHLLYSILTMETLMEIINTSLNNPAFIYYKYNTNYYG